MALLGLHHVQVNVTDVEDAVGFYRRLGLTLRDDRPDIGVEGVWLDAGPQQIHLVKATAPSDLGQHFSLEVSDLDSVMESLRRQGIPVREPRSLGPGLPRQTAIHDPAGNRVELREPPSD
jgi:glyoxylase I family protein